MPSIRPSSRAALAVALATCAAALGFSDAARAEVVAPAVSAPVRAVEKLHAALLGVMKDAEKLGYEGRVERLAPVLKETYDTPFMAEKSVGRHWKQASPADQAELVATFSRFMISNYAGRFDGYSGQSFQTLGGGALGAGHRARAHPPGGSAATRACSSTTDCARPAAAGRSSTCT